MIAMWTAVVGVLFLPANGTQIAAAEADKTGSTTLGKRVHRPLVPAAAADRWIVTALVGLPDRLALLRRPDAAPPVSDHAVM